MKFLRLFTLAGFASLALALMLAAGCEKSESQSMAATFNDEPTHAQPKLATIKLWLGAEQLPVEVAMTTMEIRTGMMFRTNIAENEGMFFVLGDPRRAGFWMKNCYVPLSVAYIDPQGVIREIHPLEPHNTNNAVSETDQVAFALETARGWFDRHNIRTGMVVRTERGSLMETFGR